MRDMVLIIEDDSFFAQTLKTGLQSRLNKRFEYFLFSTQKAAEKFIRDCSNNNFIFSIVDNHLDQQNAGLRISKQLNEHKIQFAFVSSDCSPAVLNYLRQFPFCRNIFPKDDLSLMFFQLEKDIMNSKKAFIQIKKIERSEKINLAKGILMSRYRTGYSDSTKRLQRLRESKQIDLKELAQQVITEQETFSF